MDLEKILKHYAIDEDDAARVVFPHNKYAKMAFQRVLRGDAYLDTEQLQALADLAGAPIADLLHVDTWKGQCEGGLLVFTKGPYKAKLNYKGSFVTLYKDDKKIEQLLCNLSMCTVDDFLNILNNYINGNSGNSDN